MRRDRPGSGSRLQQRPLTATVSGTFRKAIEDVQEAVYELVDASVLVLSPADPRVVDAFGDFVFVASDQVRHIRTVQARHLAAIAASDFLWLVAPDGYVGVSGAMEIGYAAAREIPVYSREVPADLTVRGWVTVVRDPREAVGRHVAAVERTVVESVLLEPVDALQAVHDDLLVAQRGLLGKPSVEQTAAAEAAIARARRRLVVP